MKDIFYLFVSLCLILGHSATNGQTIVSTDSSTRNAILEEFTGVRCVWCPDGHIKATQLTNQYPGRVFVVAYHPSNAGLATPHNGNDPDFRRSFPNVFFSTGFAGSLYLPGGFINRKKYGNSSERMLSRSVWKTKAEEIISEISPVNIGLKSVYDVSQQILTIDIELYYVEEVRPENSYYILLIENGLVSKQSSNSGVVNGYSHKRTYREKITRGQWGDIVTSFRFQGDLVTAQYTLNLNQTIDPINVSNCQIIAFVTNEDTGEIYTGTAVDADQFTTGLNDISNDLQINIYPNPCNDIFSVDLSTITEPISVILTDNSGRLIFNKQIINQKKSDFDISGIPSGIYYVKILSEQSNIIKRLVKI